jgi:hypothetical protein
MSYELYHKRYEVENEQKWREEIDRIPFIQFPGDWKIQVIPPFSDAVVRFRVQLPSGTEKSIYLDARNSLGYWDKIDEPYWEVYPYQSDIGRCGIDEINSLLEMIADESEGKDETTV